MMDAMKVAAALRRAAENAGCGLHEVVSGGGDCPEKPCSGCREASAAWANEAADAIERCAMPEGMEWLLEVWPRWSNGDYCRFGDWWTADRYGEGESRQLRRLVIYSPELLDEWEQGDGESYGYEWDFMRPSELDYRPDKVEPPAPAVLAADGEPLEAGQTVWNINNGMEFNVSRLPKPGEYQAVEVRYRNGSSTSFDPNLLTHQRPVLDADGVPIKKGDTVYLLPGEWCGEYPLRYYSAGDEMVVKELCPDHGVEGVLRCVGDGKCNCFPLPFQLTHTKPEIDTWQRIEDDVMVDATDYCEAHGIKTEYPKHCGKAKCGDLVRRCRALAERGA